MFKVYVNVWQRIDFGGSCRSLVNSEQTWECARLAIFNFQTVSTLFFIRSRKFALRLTVLTVKKSQKVIFFFFFEVSIICFTVAYTACKVIIDITCLAFYTLWWIVNVRADRFSVNRNYYCESREIEYL